MSNPMKNLTVISLEEFVRDFYWTMNWSCTGGFIGLHDVVMDYNIVSTSVMYEMDKCIRLAEKWHNKIINNMDLFEVFIEEADYYSKRYKAGNDSKDIDRLMGVSKHIERWLNE